MVKIVNTYKPGIPRTLHGNPGHLSSCYECTNLEEVMEGDCLHLRTIDLLVVWEEEPVGYPDIKQVGVLSMLLDQFQPSLVAVTTTKEDARLSVTPGNSPSFLSSQNGE